MPSTKRSARFGCHCYLQAKELKVLEYPNKNSSKLEVSAITGKETARLLDSATLRVHFRLLMSYIRGIIM